MLQFEATWGAQDPVSEKLKDSGRKSDEQLEIGGHGCDCCGGIFQKTSLYWLKQLCGSWS